jgi:hypothetical protein
MNLLSERDEVIPGVTSMNEIEYSTYAEPLPALSLWHIEKLRQ